MSEPPAPQVWPTLRAADAQALIAFLVDGLGFEETFVHGDGPRVFMAQLAWPLGGGVMLSSALPPELEDPALRPGGFAAYVVTDAPDEVFARAKAAGAAVVRDIHDTGYGSRDFSVRDPEGNLWSFGTYRGEPRRASFQGQNP